MQFTLGAVVFATGIVVGVAIAQGSVKGATEK